MHKQIQKRMAAEILQVVVKVKTRRDIFRSLNKSHILELKKAYHLARILHRFRQKSHTDQLTYLRTSKNMQLKSIVAYALYDVLSNDFRQCVNGTFETIVFGFQMFLVLDDQSCLQEGLSNLFAKHISIALEEKVDACCFWQFLKMKSEKNLLHQLRCLRTQMRKDTLFLQKRCMHCYQ